MDVKIITDSFLSSLHTKARDNERLRVPCDLRNSAEDYSQRMLNVLEPGTRVPIHRHLNTAETVVCLEGCLDWVFYMELPDVEAGSPIHDGETAFNGDNFMEIARFRICPREKQYGIQVPPMTWHSIEVFEPSTILEAKDGKYGK